LKIHAHLMAWIIIGELAGRCHRFADHSPGPFERWSRCFNSCGNPGFERPWFAAVHPTRENP